MNVILVFTKAGLNDIIQKTKLYYTLFLIRVSVWTLVSFIIKRKRMVTKFNAYRIIVTPY